MIQAVKRSSAANASPSTGNIAKKSCGSSTGNSGKNSGEYCPDERVFRFNRDMSHALTLLSEVGDRADCVVETLGALQSAADIGEVKLILRGLEYQLMDIRRVAQSGDRIGVEQ